MSPGTGTGNTKNPAELDSHSVESVKMSDEPTSDQTLRRRRPASVNPFKVNVYINYNVVLEHVHSCIHRHIHIVLHS